MYDSSAALDHALAHADPTTGFQALGEMWLDPAEELMRKEEGGTEPMADRVLILCRLLVYVFAGSLLPGEWARRVFALAREVDFGLVRGVAARGWEADCRALDDAAAAGEREIMRRRVGTGRSVLDAQGLDRGHARLGDVLPADADESWRLVLRAVLGDIYADGAAPGPVAKRVSAYAMALNHRLLVNATCEQVGGLFDGQCRATVSTRVRRIYNARVSANGGVAHAAFQKSATVVEKYRAAQMGNSNRRKKPEF